MENESSSRIALFNVPDERELTLLDALVAVPAHAARAAGAAPIYRTVFLRYFL